MYAIYICLSHALLPSQSCSKTTLSMPNNLQREQPPQYAHTTRNQRVSIASTQHTDMFNLRGNATFEYIVYAPYPRPTIARMTQYVVQ